MSVPDSSDSFEQLLEGLDIDSLLTQLHEAGEDDSYTLAPDSAEAVNPWKNCIGQQECLVKEIFIPKSLEDLRNTVTQVGSQGHSLRAVGSGHSFSNVCPVKSASDYLADLAGINAMLKIDAAVLKDSSLAPNLVAVESGIKIADFNNALDEQQVALENMGAYDGQTLAGAISTGTHGTGITLGPIASSVRALTLVAWDGTVYQIEPSDGITDPAKFQPGPNKIVLKQDDAWYNTTLVAMGCTGLIYSYVIYVVPAFYLQEYRTLDTWENLSKELANGTTSTVLTGNHGYEIDMNPYAIGGVHTCVQIRHNIVDAKKPSGWRGFKNWIAGLLSAIPGVEKSLIKKLNRWPFLTPITLKSALKVLQTPKWLTNGYIDKSFKVMNVGATVNSVTAYAMELSLPCDANLVANVNKLLELMHQLTKASPPMYLSGPLNLRFVKSSNAFLAPQAGRDTCMVELDSLFPITTASALYTRIKETMCTPNSGIRVHWGLDPQDSVSAEDVRNMYGNNFDQWLAVYKELNPTGIWDSRLTDRLGISQRRSV